MRIEAMKKHPENDLVICGGVWGANSWRLYNWQSDPSINGWVRATPPMTMDTFTWNLSGEWNARLDRWMVCNRTDLMRVHQLVKTPTRLRTAHLIVLTLKKVSFPSWPWFFGGLLFGGYIYIYYVNAKYYIDWGWSSSNPWESMEIHKDDLGD